MKRADLIGQRFGRVLVESVSDHWHGARRAWQCKCDCGTVCYLVTADMTSGKVRSCGCLKREVNRAPKTHGESRTPVHSLWLVMRQRCTNPKDKSYPDYGGRGISVCARWDDFTLFKQDMGPRPDGHEIDRIDNNGNYCPENCRWVPRAVNARNKRSNHLLIHNGKTACIAEWADITGISRTALSSRALSGWSTDRIFNQKLKSRTVKI